MKKIWIFLFGAFGYCLIELIWRKGTHWSMALAGGTALLLIYIAGRRLSVLVFPFVCTAVITAVELVFGLIFNMWLGMEVWSYSYLPFSFRGQICLPYSLLWFALGFPLYYLCAFLKKADF